MIIIIIIIISGSSISITTTTTTSSGRTFYSSIDSGCVKFVGYNLKVAMFIISDF
jgi:hypothetical protein